MSRAGRRELISSRKKPRLDAGPSVLIVTEGTQTEPNYLYAVCERLGLERHVKIERLGQDPLSCTQRALALRRESSVANYDEVWVIFDLEGPAHPFRTKALEAKNLKGAKALQFAISDPSFEVWLILHYDYSTAALVDATAAERALGHQNRWPAYGKSADMTQLVRSERVCTALNNAMRLRRHNQDTRTTNPATDVDLLVSALNARADAANRFACS